jgi:hypothetical protein
MMKKRITIRIRTDGKVLSETSGLKGKECLPYVGLLERLTDSKSVQSQFTAEYYEDVSRLSNEVNQNEENQL